MAQKKLSIITLIFISILITVITALPWIARLGASETNEWNGFPFPIFYFSGGCCPPGELCIAVPCLPHISELGLIADVAFWTFVLSLSIKFWKKRSNKDKITNI